MFIIEMHFLQCRDKFSACFYTGNFSLYRSPRWSIKSTEQCALINKDSEASVWAVLVHGVTNFILFV